VGNADPRAVQVAAAVAQAVETVGLPECRINLAQGVTYLSCAPKSNASYAAIAAAMAEIEEHGASPPPPALRDTHYPGAQALGHGVGYLYPHAPGGYVAQRHLPEGLGDRRFYEPGSAGEEEGLRRFLEQMHRLRNPEGSEGES